MLWLEQIIQSGNHFESVKNFEMQNKNTIGAKIEVKRKEISVENDFNKKARLQKELQILELRKQIISFQEKITQIRNGM